MDPMLSDDSPTPRLAGESSAAYASFLKYRDLGPFRTIAGVLRADAKPAEKKNRRQLEFWSGHFSWVGRCRTFDAYTEAVAQRARDAVLAERARAWELRRLESIEDAYSDGKKLRHKALEMLAHGLIVEESSEDGTTKIVKPARWTMREAATFLRISAELRAAACEAIDAGYPVESMTDGELTAIERVHFDLSKSDGEMGEVVADGGVEGGLSKARED